MTICEHYKRMILERRIDALEQAIMEINADYSPPCRTPYDRDAVIALSHKANEMLEHSYASFQECSLALKLFEANEDDALNHIVEMHTSQIDW